MIELASAVIGAVAVTNTGAVLYAAYLRGANDATAPDEIVDMGEVESYNQQVAAMEALEGDLRSKQE